jgi:hypothetical protein
VQSKFAMGLGRRFQNYPRLLERAYRLTLWLFARSEPLLRRIGSERLQRWMRGPEEAGKRSIFDCRMCGQCVLHSTGMTCPMTCPKNLRNGPCGGVRANGNCEVEPGMRCVWVEAYDRSLVMTTYGDDLRILQPPLNRQLEGSSAWVNLLTGIDRPPLPGWPDAAEKPKVRN